MDKILTQEEIDELLDEISASDNDCNEDSKKYTSSRRIKIYDFKRPDAFTKEHIRTFYIWGDLFARKLSNYLRKICNKDVNLFLASIDQITYEEFYRCMPTPTTIIKSSLWKDKPFALEIDPTVYSKITGTQLDKKLKKVKHYKTNEDGSESSEIIEEQKEVLIFKNLTEKEEKIWLQDYIKPILKIFGETLKENFHTKFNKISNIKYENNPAFLEMTYPSNTVLLCTFECRFPEEEDDTEMINICFSSELASKLLNELNGIEEPESKSINLSLFNQTSIECEAILGKSKKTIAEVMELGEGSIIELNKLAGEPVDIKINGTVLAKGEVIVIDENFGVRITEML